MEGYGRCEFDAAQGKNNADGFAWFQRVQTLYSFASTDPDTFLTALADAVVPSGGWAAYGASHAVWDLVHPRLEDHAAYNAIVNTSLKFLRESGVPPMFLIGYEWKHWVALGGTNETWLPRQPTPSPSAAPITDLAAGETRRVAQFTASADSNVFLVRKDADGRFVAVIEAPYSSEDPTRSQSDWKAAESLHQLYEAIGLACQTPCYWYDKELGPFFPLPRPTV
jgi:hypothetical protein